MATFVAIPEKTQTATSMKRVLDYVMQDKKTDLDGIKLVSGQNCVAESAFEEFMATKHRFGKAKGVFFKQYVQSFKPDCGATPQQIHQIGIETAKAFDGFEVVVATHIDRDHWHNHFVVNSVNCETGYKIQINEKGLEKLRQRSDEICEQFGMQVLSPYQKPKQHSLNQREYRAAVKGNSRKIKLTNAIDHAVALSRTKNEFIEQMKKLGYGVKWIDRYKYITYTTPEGQAFRDNRLLDDKYLKSNMEELYYEYARLKTTEPDRTIDGGNSRSFDRADTAHISSADSEAVQLDCSIYLTVWQRHCKKYGFDIETTHQNSDQGTGRGHSGASGTQIKGYSNGTKQSDPFFSGVRIIEADGEIEGLTPSGAEILDGRTESQGSFSVEAEAQVGGNWSDIALGGIRLAADIAMIGEYEDDKPKQKSVREKKHGHKKNQNQDDHSDDGGMQMNM